MPIPDSTLKGILKLVKQINAQLGTAAGSTLHADLAAATVNEEAMNVVLDTATADEATSNALLDTLVTAEGVVNGIVDDIATLVGTGGKSFTLLTTDLEALLE